MTAYEGLVYGLPEAEYHSLPGLSSTGAKLMIKSALTYQHNLTAPPEEKEEYALGSAVHTKVLGVGSKVAIFPDGTGSETFEYDGKELVTVLSSNGTTGTNAARAFADDARSKGLIPMKRVQANVVNKMAESVLSNSNARSLFENGEPEVSMFATDPATGVPMRGRLDYLGKRIADLKTSGGEASEHGFSKSVFDLGYHIQFGWYEHLYELITGETKEWLWVVVETKAPYQTCVHILGNDEAEMGRKSARVALRRYARAYETGIWPGYTHRTGTPVGIIQAPWWAISEYEALMATEREVA